MGMRMAITVSCDWCEQELVTTDDIEVTVGDVIGCWEEGTYGLSLVDGCWVCAGCADGGDE